MNSIQKRIRPTLALFFLLLGFSTQQVFALDSASIGGRPAYPQEGNTRTESIFVHTIEPGSSADDGILVLNNSNEEKTLVVYAVDSVNSSDGAFACAQDADLRQGVGAWTTLASSEVTLPAGKNAIVPFTITVPENVGVGEANGCIIIQEKKLTTVASSGINFSFRTGIRIAVTVPGDIIRAVIIESFNHTVLENGIHQLNISAQNTGNVSIDTTISTHVESLFGRTLYDQSGDFPILRNQSAQWHFELPESFWGGWYKSTLTVSYDAAENASIGVESGSAKKILTAQTQWFFVMPSRSGMMIEIGIVLAMSIMVGAVYITLRRKQWMSATWVPYTISEGDDIQRVATKHNVAWKVLAQGNSLKAPYALVVGSTLRVPPLPKTELDTQHDAPVQPKTTKKVPAKKKAQR